MTLFNIDDFNERQGLYSMSVTLMNVDDFIQCLLIYLTLSTTFRNALIITEWYMGGCRQPYLSRKGFSSGIYFAKTRNKRLFNNRNT